ncbi:IclR family transcriptional regulator C-terminal domain-containing protein [Streptomyces sp. NPDC094458]|uniref:IclR family transcriptional regulator domain-containing protein n=1 Tax=Streptomyces sp. NPDC094458 TaxID=3155208 RepID=UPI003324AF28
MGESVAGRLFSVLDAFEGGGPAALRLTDIAARTGLPAPTALRLVRELVAWGGLERGADGRYRLGLRPPAHATAYGKVLLAGPPEELPRHTRHTVVSPGLLAGQLARVREAGLAVCAEEFRLGEVSVAAPVRGPSGTVAALGVTVPTGVPLERVAAAVREAALRVRPPEPSPA